MNDLINSNKKDFTIKTSEELKYIIGIETRIAHFDDVDYVAIDIQGNEIPFN